jgi:hypothetical protein
MMDMFGVMEEKKEDVIINITIEKVKPLLKDKQPEMSGIVSSITKRYVENLLNLIITTGIPGMGKSYADLRMSEEIRRRLGFKDVYGGIKFVRKKSELSQVFLNAKFGDCVIIEEGSFMINSKRSMSSENVESGVDIDTIRKKNLVVFVNLPLQKSLDSHWRDMASHLVEMQRLDKVNGFSVAKCFEVNFNKYFAKSIPNYIRGSFKSPNGRMVSRKVKETWFGKPLNEQLIKDYEDIKDKHMDMILTRNYLKAKAREEKEDKKLYGLEIDDSKKNEEQKKINERNEKIIEYRNKNLSPGEISPLVGLSRQQIYNILNKAKAKEGK